MHPRLGGPFQNLSNLNLLRLGFRLGEPESRSLYFCSASVEFKSLWKASIAHFYVYIPLAYQIYSATYFPFYSYFKIQIDIFNCLIWRLCLGALINLKYFG